MPSAANSLGNYPIPLRGRCHVLTMSSNGVMLSAWCYADLVLIRIWTARKPRRCRAARIFLSLKTATSSLLGETSPPQLPASCRQAQPAGRMNGSSLSLEKRSSRRSATSPKTLSRPARFMPATRAGLMLPLLRQAQISHVSWIRRGQAILGLPGGQSMSQSSSQSAGPLRHELASG